MNKNLKKLDIFLLILFPILSVLISFAFKVNFLTSALLFFGLPSIYLSVRTPSQIKKALIFSLIFLIPFCFIIDYIAILDHSWFVPLTVFPFHILGVIPVEDFIWGYLITYSIVIFYEHFFGKNKSEIINKRMIHLILPLFILLLIFFVVLFTNPGLLIIPYAYLWMGTVFVLLPIIIFLLFFPSFSNKYIKVASYFFFLTILFEITGLQLNHWTFPGNNFIGWVNIFGYHFPLEEFFFLCVLGSTAVLSYYQFFNNDRE